MKRAGEPTSNGRTGAGVPAMPEDGGETDGPDGADERLRYDPSRMRDASYGTTTIGALLHLMKSSIGTGTLAMANAFKNGGLAFGLFGTIAVGTLCAHCIYILVADQHTSPEWQFSIRAWILGLALPLLPFGCIRSLRLLVPFSAIATTCVLVGLGCTVIWVIDGVSPFSAEDAVPLPDIRSRPWIAPAAHMPLFFTTVLFAMEGIGTVLPIENSMSHPQQFLRARPCGVLNAAMTLVVVLYGLCGFLGYLRFGDATKGSITLNLPNDLFSEVVKIMVALSVVFSYGLQFCVPSEIAWAWLEPRLRGRIPAGGRAPPAEPAKSEQPVPDTRPVGWPYYAMRATMILITFVIAAIVPNLAPVISLFGAIFFSVLGLFCPAVIHLATFWDRDDGGGEDDAAGRLELGTDNAAYDGGADPQTPPRPRRSAKPGRSGGGMSRWTVAKDVAIVSMSVISLVTGSYVSMLDIISSYGSNTVN